MKRLIAIVLVIALTISACASPAGTSGGQGKEISSASEETAGTSGESPSVSEEAQTAEDLAEAEWTGVDRPDREEGFVPAGEAEEEPAAGKVPVTEEEPVTEKEPAAEEESAAEEPYEASEDSSPQQDAKPSLVILEENEDEYRRAANLKASDIDLKTSRLHAVTSGSGDAKARSSFIEKYVHYFNNERLSYKLNYKTPVQYKIEQGFG